MGRRSLLIALLAAVLFAGCKPASAPVAPSIDPAAVVPTPTPVVVTPENPVSPIAPVPDEYGRLHDRVVNSIAEPSRQERYDSALLDAISHIADQKYNLALLDLQTAQGLNDTDTVRTEIARVTELLAQQDQAVKTVQDLQTVLKDGPVNAATDLSNDALKQLGGTDQGQALADLNRQAETLRLAEANDLEQAKRRKQLLADAETAKQENNLRAAVIAYETALADAPPDDPLRAALEEMRGKLVRYDEQRTLGNRLRRDRVTLEDALPALLQAQEAWDTPSIRSDIDEVRFALSRCRDRLGVADFEVRGDIGWAGAGRTVADALLGGFKRRFDLVERGQFDRVVGELQLAGTQLGDDDAGRREVGRLARLKYLVVGSISPLNGVTVHARLVNVQTGLVEQTARLSAPTLDQLVNRLDVLALMLQMNDEQRLALEAQLIDETVRKANALAQVQPIPPLADNQPLPPAPVFQPNQPPPPIAAFAVQPAGVGAPVEVVLDDLRRLPPPVIVLAPQLVVVAPTPVLLPEVRGRLLALELDLGDNLFRRGRFREAHRHYQLALTLSGGNADVQLRIGRVMVFLPPPPPPPLLVVPPPQVVVGTGQVEVVVNPFVVQQFPPPPPLVVIAPPPPLRPRVAVFQFLVHARPGLVSPFLGDIAADHLSGYLGSRYETIDRNELWWTMWRLNLTMRDVLNDASARWMLCQALNASYLVFGSIEETASFNVTTYLIDAQTGTPAALGFIHVHSHEEMKWRMGELAAQMGATPAQQAILVQSGRDSEDIILQIRGFQTARRFREAADLGHTAVQKYPESIALRSLVFQVEIQQHRAETDSARQVESERQARNAENMRRQYVELTARSTHARQEAEAEAKLRDADGKARQEAARKQAYDRLVKQGQQAEGRQAYPQAVQSLRSAVALYPNAEGFRKLAEAERSRDLAHQVQVTEETRRKSEADAKVRDVAIVRLATAHKEQETQATAQRKQESLQAAKLAEQSRKDMGSGKVDEALSAARAAHSLHPTAETQDLVSQAEHAQELKLARGEQQRKEIEARQAEDRRKQEAYAVAMKKAGEAVTAHQYEAAVAQYDSAVKLYHTDSAAGGLTSARHLLERDKAVQDAEKNKAAEQPKKTTEIKKLLTTAQERLGTHQYKEADADYDLVLKYDPASVEARAGKGQVAVARADYERQHAADLDRARKQEQVKVLVTRGKTDLDGKRYEAALSSLNEAVRLDPANAEAITLQKRAQDYRNALARDEETGQKRKADFDRLLAQGRTELGDKSYTAAAKTLADAQKLMPDNAEAKTYLAQAQQGMKTQENEGKVAGLVADARKAMGGKDYAKADGLLADARKLAPQNAEVTRATDELALARKPGPVDPKRKADYEHAMSAGEAAVTKQNYSGAINSYREALRLQPGDAVATSKLDAATKLQATATERMNEEQRTAREKSYVAALAKGRSALAGQQADAAITEAEEALRLKPGDKDATALLASAQATKSSLGKKREDFTRLVASGKAALTAKRPDEAIKDADDALKLYPGDKDATLLRSEASAFKTAMSEAGNKAEAVRLVGVGRAALAGKRYDEAIKNAGDALRLMPGDPTATALQREATAAKNAATPPPPNPQAEFARLFQAGQDADRQKKYADAVSAYGDALKIMPNDAKARSAMRGASFNMHVEEGKKQLSMKKFPEAQAEFEAALREFPNDPDTKTLLQKAKDRKQ